MLLASGQFQFYGMFPRLKPPSLFRKIGRGPVLLPLVLYADANGEGLVRQNRREMADAGRY